MRATATLLSRTANLTSPLGHRELARKALLDNRDDNPLLEALAATFGPDSADEKLGSTVDIVSPGLCDDVLKYIGPSLEQYKGCDIIDVHPGACLWSQKLHDVLQPRRHLLMEPETRYYKPFIEPLLQKPGSAYRHTSLSGANATSYFDSYNKIFNDEELLLKRDPLQAGDVRLRQPNRSLLVTGTLFRRYEGKAKHINRVAPTNLILNHMIHAAQTNKLFHIHGLVRMLLWNPEEVRHTIIPESTIFRGAFSTSLEVAADMVLVAGKDKTDDHYNPYNREAARYRYPWMDQLSNDATLRNMDKAGISMPEHRQTESYKAAVERRSLHSSKPEDEKREDYVSACGVRPLLDNEPLEAAIAEHASRTADFLKLHVGLDSSTKLKLLDLPYKFKFSSADNTLLKEKDRSHLGPYVELWGRQVALETALSQRKATQNASVTKKMTKQLLRCARELRESFGHRTMMSKQRRGIAAGLIHELHGFHHKLLPADRRPYEPLVVEAKEFWPPQAQYLLDIQPREDNMADDLISPFEANEKMRHFTTQLWGLSAQSVNAALERIGSGAAKDLLPNLPSLTDASKGGRLDAEDMAVRLLTPDMVRDITKAYFEWPFRPDEVE